MPQRREPLKQGRQAGMHLSCRLQLRQDLLGKGPLVVEPQLPAPQTAMLSTVRLALFVSACRTITLCAAVVDVLVFGLAFNCQRISRGEILMCVNGFSLPPNGTNCTLEAMKDKDAGLASFADNLFQYMHIHSIPKLFLKST